MYCDTWISVVLISVTLATASASNRKISRCRADDSGENSPRYKVGATYETSSGLDGGPPMSVVQISINHENLNHDDLLRLARKLKRDFCKEQRLFVVLYDNALYIDHIYVSNDVLFHAAEEAK